MVTRRAVLKGTAAASIGAIASAHGAEASDGAASLDLGYGQLTGGAIGGFVKQPDAFQIAFKFDKASAELILKEQPGGGVAVFSKAFFKGWSPQSSEPLDATLFPDLKSADLYFEKVHPAGALVTVQFDKISWKGQIDSTTDGVFFKFFVNGD